MENRKHTARIRRAMIIALLFTVLFAFASAAFAAEKPTPAPTATPRPTAVPAKFGELPPPCDVLLVAAHPGDETAYFGALLAEAAGAKGLDVRVVYLSCGSEELGNYAKETLAAFGVKNAPEFLELGPIYYETRQHAANNMNVDKLVRDFTDLVRMYKPRYIVTHDPEGEFGHGLHIIAAELVTRACQNSYSPKKLGNSVKAYGTHAPERIYYHAVRPEGAVGPDPEAMLKEGMAMDAVRTVQEKLKGLIPNLPEAGSNVYTQQVFVPVTPPGAEGTDEGLFGEGPVPALEETAEASLPALEETAETAGSFSNDFGGGIFLEPGAEETVVVNGPEGRWEYRGENLTVLIDHREFVTEENSPVAYNVAHIYMRNEDAFVPGVRESKAHEYPWYMARRYKAVLAITGDNMTVAEGKSKGVIIRDGKVYNDRAGADTLAMGTDGTLKIYAAGTVTADELLAKGVRNTFSFGPTLITDGRIQHDEILGSKVERKNPRVAIGMIEPGHLVVIQVDGRQNGYSGGVSLEMLATLFWTEGCTEAYNLDGGRSTALVFMGEHINRHAGNSSDIQRALPDALMWGRSELVPETTDPVWNTGNGPRDVPYILQEKGKK